MDLGEVARSLAIHGVEVAASIPSHGSITIEFGAEAAGNYLFEVSQVGEGLTIEATGPSGSASLNPGPTGPASTIALPLKAVTYQIKASATGDQPVFVDWELLLMSGVGQSAAIGTMLAAPSAPLPPSLGPGVGHPFAHELFGEWRPGRLVVSGLGDRWAGRTIRSGQGDQPCGADLARR